MCMVVKVPVASCTLRRLARLWRALWAFEVCSTCLKPEYIDLGPGDLCGAICACSHTVACRSMYVVTVMLSALVLTLSPATPDSVHALHVTGYEPQRSGTLGDKQPAHFTIEEIPCTPSRSHHSLDTSPKRLSAYTQHTSCCQSVCTPCHLCWLAPCCATPRAPRQRDPRTCQAAPQLPHCPTVWQRIGTTAKSTTVWHRLHRS
jgi:hypothetical protein